MVSSWKMPLAYPNPPFSRCATCHGTKSAVYRRLYLRAMGQGRQLLICAIIGHICWFLFSQLLAKTSVVLGVMRGAGGAPRLNLHSHSVGLAACAWLESRSGFAELFGWLGRNGVSGERGGCPASPAAEPNYVPPSRCQLPPSNTHALPDKRRLP